MDGLDGLNGLDGLDAGLVSTLRALDVLPLDEADSD